MRKILIVSAAALMLTACGTTGGAGVKIDPNEAVYDLCVDFGKLEHAALPLIGTVITPAAYPKFNAAKAFGVSICGKVPQPFVITPGDRTQLIAAIGEIAVDLAAAKAKQP